VIPQYDLPDVPNVGKRIVREPNNARESFGFALTIRLPTFGTSADRIEGITFPACKIHRLARSSSNRSVARWAGL